LLSKCFVPTDLGIISGYPDDTFRPVRGVSRAEFAKMIILAIGEAPASSYQGYFSDVNTKHWAWRYIEKARELGIISGYPDNTFRPDKEISRAEIAKIIIKARELPLDISGVAFSDVPTDHWAYDYIMTARNNDIVRGYVDGTFRPKRTATRAEACKMLFMITD
jgi:hypothetical protein